MTKKAMGAVTQLLIKDAVFFSLGHFSLLFASICYTLEQKSVICWLLELNFWFALFIDFSMVLLILSMIFTWFIHGFYMFLLDASMVIIDVSMISIDSSWFCSIFPWCSLTYPWFSSIFHGVHRFFRGFNWFFTWFQSISPCIICTRWTCRIQVAAQPCWVKIVSLDAITVLVSDMFRVWFRFYLGLFYGLFRDGLGYIYGRSRDV